MTDELELVPGAIGDHTSNCASQGSDGLTVSNQYKEIDISVAIAYSQTSKCASEGNLAKVGWIHLRPKISCYCLTHSLANKTIGYYAFSSDYGKVWDGTTTTTYQDGATTNLTGQAMTTINIPDPFGPECWNTPPPLPPSINKLPPPAKRQVHVPFRIMQFKVGRAYTLVLNADS
jgi:hypothetical protein